MTQISILGSGRVATTLATKLVSAGHQVTIGSRDVAKAEAEWADKGVRVTDSADAVQGASIVINATPGEGSLERLSALKDELGGKILIDVSNATERGPGGMPGDLLYPNSSLAEKLQAALPDTAVIKTLNTMLFMVMTAPGSLQVPPTAFVSGNDQGAKTAVTALLGELGWPPESVIDLGDIGTAKATEALILLVGPMLQSQGMKPFAVSVAR